MADTEAFIREQAKALRDKDEAPKTKADWENRKADLRNAMFAAMGEPLEPQAKPCDLAPRILGTLKRDGYRVEKLILQTRPNVWATASAYVPDVNAKAPAVLVVHGHWPWARRDPVVQARCLGLVKLGFFVLAIDAFGAGERFDKPAKGTYHGALYGATLWPVGKTLLGMQIFDNRRAVDYLLSRPEVNGKLGITGASGGGNQSMYAGALDERFAAVAPVCSVGNYQAYLRNACCVCEVLPGALKFTEEGDVLGLVAPRALLVLNASKDSIQFSPAEASKSVGRAREIFKLLDVDKNLQHTIFETHHDYNQAMREAMYGWMTLHLKGEGKGEPIPEPKHTVETIEDLACFPDLNDRPKGFLFPATYAYQVGKELIAKADKLAPDHSEMWEATALVLRSNLKKALGGVPPLPKQPDEAVKPTGKPIESTAFLAVPEVGVTVAAKAELQLASLKPDQAPFDCVILHYDGPPGAQKHPIYDALAKRGARITTCWLRGTTPEERKQPGVRGALDHHLAQHALWIGRPLLGQWGGDVRAVVGRLAAIADRPTRPVIVGIGPMGLVALGFTALFPDKARTTILIDAPATYLTDAPYADGTTMAILTPGLLKVGDVSHLAALAAPHRLVIAGGVTFKGEKVGENDLGKAFGFTGKVYEALKAAGKLTITTQPDWANLEL
jgi:dienelactone hydrolase/pimeloyl-ACP methyl ester carboxylesterase